MSLQRTYSDNSRQYNDSRIERVAPDSSRHYSRVESPSRAVQSANGKLKITISTDDYSSKPDKPQQYQDSKHRDLSSRPDKFQQHQDFKYGDRHGRQRSIHDRSDPRKRTDQPSQHYTGHQRQNNPPYSSHCTKQMSGGFRDIQRSVPSNGLKGKRRNVYSSPVKSFTNRTYHRGADLKYESRSNVNHTTRSSEHRSSKYNGNHHGSSNGSFHKNFNTANSPPHCHNRTDSDRNHRQSDRSRKVRSSDVTPKETRIVPSDIGRRSSNLAVSKKSSSRGTPAMKENDTVPSKSSSSSEDERAIRMKLLKEKYAVKSSKNKFVDHDRVTFVKQERDDHLDDEIFKSQSKGKNKEASSSSVKSHHDRKIPEEIRKRKLTGNEKDRHKSDHSQSPKGSSNSTKQRKVLDYDPVLMSKKYDSYKKKKNKNVVVSSSSSSSSDSDSSSSSSSSEESPVSKQTLVKHSRWNSGSSNDSLVRSSEQNSLSKPMGPPLASKDILKKVKPANRDSMIRQRNCKYCALYLKTKDDVDRHTMTQRHRIVTGEFFLDRDYLIGSPYKGDAVQCTICNAPIGSEVLIERHEDSSQHRQQLHRWLQRHQPVPPIKYYIDPV